MTTEDIREKLADIISKGLVQGLGKPEPGHLCVEAAICLALGEPHSSRPSPVAEADRAFAIVINDAAWSSPQARAEALLLLALAQLGTAGKDRTEWVRRVVIGTVRRVLPIALRAAGLEDHAVACETATTLDEAAEASRAAQRAADADHAHAEALAAFADDASRAADADAAHASDVAASAATFAAYAAEVADYSTEAACVDAVNDAASAASAATFAIASADPVLRVAVQVALDAYAEERP